MFHSIAKWYISRAIDCNKALPTWVERRMTHDPSLKQFHEQSLQLAARLRQTNSAPAQSFGGAFHVELGKPLQDLSLRRSRSAARLATLAIGLAAIVLLALIPFYNRSGLNPGLDPVVVSTELAESGAGKALVENSDEPTQVDKKRLRELLASGRTLMQGLKQRAEEASEPALEVNFEQLAAFVNLDVDQVIQPVNDLGSSYGEFLSQVDRSIETENRRLMSEGVGAWNYFVHKLPRSAASLAGL